MYVDFDRWPLTNMRKIICFAVLLLSVRANDGAAAFQTPVPHAVTGKVTDAHGLAMAGASVAAIPVDDQGSAGDFGWMRTDGKGVFRIMLRPGHYIVRAKNEEDGYPDPSFLLSSDPNAKFPRIWVDQADISGLLVTLGARGGIVQGELRDEVTGQAIPKGKVTISDARNPEAFVEVFADRDGHFHFTVPSKPVKVSASAAGYTAGYADNGRELVLSEGEHRTVELELKPNL